MLFRIFLILLVCSALISINLAIYAIRHRERPGALPFALALFAGFIMSSSYLSELLASTHTIKIIWDNIQYTASDISVIGIFVFALTYTERQYLIRRCTPVLWALVLLDALVVWTDPYHHMLRTSTTLVTSNTFTILSYDYGPWFWCYIVYSYMLFMASVIMLSIYFVRAPRYYQLQIGAVVLGITSPFAGGIITTAGLVPLPGLERLDILPITYTLAGCLWAWGLFRQRLLDLVPIARSKLIEYLPDGMIVLDANHRIVDINPSIQTLLQCDTNSCIGKELTEAFPFLAHVIPTHFTQWTINIDISDKNTNHLVTWIEMSITPLNDRHQSFLGWLLILRDRTHQWHMEQALRESETRYRALVESSTDTIFQIDRQGYYIYINTAGSQSMGYSPNDICGRHLTDVLEPPTANLSLHMLQTIVETSQPLSIEVPFKVDNQSVYYSIVAAPVTSPTGKVLSVVGIGRDITERKHMEKALHQAKEAAEAANHAKSTFLASMSHELRTPLNAILGFAQLLALDEHTPDTQKDHLNIINRSGEHLLSLINDILDMSKIEAGHITLQENIVDMHRLIDDVTDMFSIRATSKGIYIHTERAPSVPRIVQVDSGKLRQVLINLLSNAIKFTHEGEVIFRISRLPTSEHASSCPNSNHPLPTHCSLCFEVQDTGVGIAPDKLHTIFEPFSQTSTHQYGVEGTGLGLAISQRFVHMMYGTIQAQSESGHGSLFRCVIPVQETHATDVPVDLSYRQIAGLAPGQPTYRILIVEDAQDNRILLRKMLAFPGLYLREAHNGQEAIEIWDQWAPHLIFMDMQMPIMNGYDATRHIKARMNERHYLTVIVALTASVFTEDRAIILATGCDDILRKPVRQYDIMDALIRHLDVQLVYKDTVPTKKKHSQETLTSNQLEHILTNLPHDILESLEQATLNGEPGPINNSITQIRTYHEGAAEALQALAEDFEYTQIRAIIRSILQ